MSVRHFPWTYSPDVFPSRKPEGRTFPPLRKLAYVGTQGQVTSQKLSNAIYMQDRSIVEVRVNIFYIFFRHTLRGTVKWVSGCFLCWVMANGSRIDNSPLDLLCTSPLNRFHCLNCRPIVFYCVTQICIARTYYGNVAGWLSVTRRNCINTAKPILKLFSTIW